MANAVGVVKFFVATATMITFRLPSDATLAKKRLGIAAVLSPVGLLSSIQGMQIHIGLRSLCFCQKASKTRYRYHGQEGHNGNNNHEFNQRKSLFHPTTP